MSEDETRAAWLDREPYASLMLADYATEVLAQARARGESLDGYRLVLRAEPASWLPDNPQLRDKPGDGPTTRAVKSILRGEGQPDA